MYHKVCPAKYRRAMINDEVDKKLREICLGIEARFKITFLEIGTRTRPCALFGAIGADLQPRENSENDKEPNSAKNIRIIPRGEKMLRGGEFWTRGYYIGTVGEHGSE